MAGKRERGEGESPPFPFEIQTDDSRRGRGRGKDPSQTNSIDKLCHSLGKCIFLLLPFPIFFSFYAKKDEKGQKRSKDSEVSFYSLFHPLG